jgi:formiminoglutamate deiminase
MKVHAELAWVEDGVEADVLIEIHGERFTAVRAGVPAPPDAERLAGLTLPGFANAHSHAFHRALRGRVQAERGTFWTWRETMYAVAERLDPDSYFALARAVYGEMALAGIACVGEFHYLHHRPDGRPYADPNAMGEALIAAAEEARIRITLLDACYLTGGIDRPPSGAQLRFSDGSAHAWAERVATLVPPSGHARAGAAVHSVRAVPPDQIRIVAEAAAGLPVHVHLSEQPAENEACLAAYGCTPAEVLAEHGALGRRTVAVHATHLTDADVRLLGGTSTGVCVCPTTEHDLADGLGPARAVAEAGSPLSLGSDQHAVIDMFAEARGLELGERSRSLRRGNFHAAELLAAATVGGHGALGWASAGRIEPGNLADLVTVGMDSVRLAGAGRSAESAVFAATAADVRSVIVSGRQVVSGGRHVSIDVPGELALAIGAVT